MAEPENTKTELSVTYGAHSFEEHPERAALLGELHARPFEKIEIPARVFLMAFLTNAEQAAEDRKTIEKLCAAHALSPPAPNANYHSIKIGRWHFRWEQHNEFTAYRWDIGSSECEGFGDDEAARLLAELEFTAPGPLIVATQVKLSQDHLDVSDYEKIFNPVSLCFIETDRGKARVATDFEVDLKGFTRFIIEDHGMSPYRAGALLQRLLEVETYRMLALLGLPVAKRALPVVNETQSGLADLTREIAAADGIEDNHHLLKKLTDLAARLEAQSAQTSYRFSAAQAYYDIVMSRLAAMHENSVNGARRFSSFFKRRLTPAIATCQMVEDRQNMLSRKLVRTAELLRTRIQFELEQQNRILLQSMNRRAKMQLRLQQTVEGLSVAAVSYYIVGLIKYLAEGLFKTGMTFGISPSLIAAASVPLVLLGVFWTVRRIHKRFGNH